jgi:hypothetical protein
MNTDEKFQKILYRPHKGSLEDSMQELCEFSSVPEMTKHIVQDWRDAFGNGVISSEDIVVNETDMGADPRIGWRNTHYVCAKRIGKETCSVPQCIGMCCINEKEEE